MNNVDFGNTDFLTCNFNDIKKIDYSRCNLSRANSISTTWSENVNKTNLSSPKAYYQQIHKFYEDEGDIENKLKFKALLLNTILENTPNKWDRFSLTLGSISSDHGTNYIKPIKLILSFSFFNFCLINKIILDNEVFNYGVPLSQLGRDNISWFSIKDAFVFMNPIHLMKYYDFKGNDLFFIWDFISKIINGYLIFQVGRSIRKFLR